MRVLPLGGLLGRSLHSAVRIDDPAISEAHALLSWRSGELRLVALRRRLAIHGQPVEEARVFEGDEIELAPGWVIEVLEVVLPTHVLMIEAPGLPTQLLPEVAAISLGPPPTLSTRPMPEAAAIVWQSPDAPAPGAHIRRADGVEITPDGDGRFMLDATPFWIHASPTGAVADAATGRSSEREALNVHVDGDRVRICLSGREVLFQGVQGRLLRILVIERVPCDWAPLAHRVWADRADWDLLRSRLDTTVCRIRRRLRDAGFEPALLRTNGAGSFVLALEPRDLVDLRA